MIKNTTIQASTKSKLQRTNKLSLALLFLFFLTFFSCYSIPDKIEPKISYAVQNKYLRSLPSPFPPLSHEERKEGWGQEYLIGITFAKQLDLYRAITAFKRAEIIIPPDHKERKRELAYNILLCYYLGQKFEDVVETFSQSDLAYVDPSFPAYHDLLLIMYESYKETNDMQKAGWILDHLEKSDPETAKKLRLSTALQKGHINDLYALSEKEPNPLVDQLLDHYTKEKKSIKTAQRLNLIPGAGYLYVGQKQSAITSFLLNGLFIAGAALFYKNGNIPAGVIMTSLEMGWYFGGIYGAGESAKLYNERLYEANAYLIMNKQHLSPALMIKYAF